MTANRTKLLALAILVLTLCSISQADIIEPKVYAVAQAGNQASPFADTHETTVIGRTVSAYHEAHVPGAPDDRFETIYEAGYTANASATAGDVVFDRLGDEAGVVPSFHLSAEANSWDGSGGVSTPHGGAFAMAEVEITDIIKMTVLTPFLAPVKVFHEVKVEGAITSNGTIDLSIDGVQKSLHPTVFGGNLLLYNETFSDVGEVTINGFNLTSTLNLRVKIMASHIGLAAFSNTVTVTDVAFYDATGNRLQGIMTSALGFNYTFNDVQAIPEPGTLTLAGLGAVGFAAGAWRRRIKMANRPA